MQFHRNELFLVYNPKSNTGKQTKALAMDICNHINEVDVAHERLSPTYWHEIIKMTGAHPSELLDETHPDFRKQVGGNNYTMDGWLELLVHSGHLVKYPIVIFNQNAVICHTPTDIMKLKPRADEKVLPHLKNYR